MAPKDELLSEYFRQQKPNDAEEEEEKLEKYHRLKEELEKRWGVKATVVPVVIKSTGGCDPTNWESGSSRFQVQHLRALSRRVQS